MNANHLFMFDHLVIPVWIPPNERSTILAVTSIGTQLGIVSFTINSACFPFMEITDFGVQKGDHSSSGRPAMRLRLRRLDINICTNW